MSKTPLKKKKQKRHQSNRFNLPLFRRRIMQCRANLLFQILIVFPTNLSLKFQYNFATPHMGEGLVSRKLPDSAAFYMFLTKIASFDFFEIFLKLDEGQKMSGENPFQATIAFP